MNAKAIFSTALVLTVLSLNTAHGQTPGGPTNPLDMLPTPMPPSGPGPGMNSPQPGQMPGGPTNPLDMLPPPTPLGGASPGIKTPQVVPPGQLSPWIRGDKYGCCGEPGGDGPIQTELFTRIGPALVAGNGTIADVLQTGLYLGAGGRVLFFNPAMTSAWTVELSLSHTYNHAHAPTTYPGIPLNILVPPSDPSGVPERVFFGEGDLPGVTVREFHRMFFNVGVGHEWYVMGSASCNGPSWRFGVDGGGRWGSASIDFNEIRHRTDVIGGVWAAAHTDLEIPMGCCVLQWGFRVEYGYTWSDILQIQNKSDVQDINLLFNAGIRF